LTQPEYLSYLVYKASKGKRGLTVRIHNLCGASRGFKSRKSHGGGRKDMRNPLLTANTVSLLTGANLKTPTQGLKISSTNQ